MVTVGHNPEPVVLGSADFPQVSTPKSNLLNLNLTSSSTTFKGWLLAKHLNHYLWIRSLIICRTQHQILNLPFRALCSSTKPTTHTHPHFSPTQSSYYSHTWIHVFLHIHTDAKIVLSFPTSTHLLLLFWYVHKSRWSPILSGASKIPGNLSQAKLLQRGL